MEAIKDEKKPANNPPSPAANQDLSAEIERVIERQPFDRVKCSRVFDNRYRCNWWAPGDGEAPNNRTADWALYANQRVRVSRFFTATLDKEGALVIEDIATKTE